MSEETVESGASNTELEKTTPPAGEGAENENPPKAEESQPTIDLVGEEFEFSIAEGAEVDKESLAELKKFFVDKKMTKDTAQATLDHLLASRAKSQEAQKEINEKAVAEEIKKIKADPAIGGSNYETVQSAAEAITLKYGGEDFRKSVVEGGLKNDFQFLRFIRNLNSVLTEDKTITTSQAKESLDRPLTREEEANKFFEKD